MAARRSLAHPVSGETVVCTLCQLPFRAITVSHLRFRHQWSSPEPVQLYKLRYPGWSSQSRTTRQKRRQAQIIRCTQLGTLWTEAKLVALLRTRLAAGKAINLQAVRKDIPSARRAAQKLFKGWDAFLRSQGIDPARIRLRKRRTRAGLLEEGRALLRLNEDLSARAVHRNHPAFEDAVLARFRSWDAFLIAIGEDPSRHRKRRRWTLALVRRAIRTMPRVLRTREVQRADLSLHAAAGRYIGPWKKAVEECGRVYPD
jgi:hypothetical protein